MKVCDIRHLADRGSGTFTSFVEQPVKRIDENSASLAHSLARLVARFATALHFAIRFGSMVNHLLVTCMRYRIDRAISMSIIRVEEKVIGICARYPIISLNRKMRCLILWLEFHM